MSPATSATESTESLLASISEGRATLNSLVRALRLGKKYSLHFALCNRPADRTLLIAAVRDEFPSEAIREFNLDTPVENLYRLLREVEFASSTRAIVVYGMESWIRSDDNANDSPFLLNLNAARDSLSAVLTCPLVLWIPEYMLRLLFDAASDFMSVRSGTYDFRSRDVLSYGMFERETAQYTQFDNAPAEDRRRLIADLEVLIAEFDNGKRLIDKDITSLARFYLSAAQQRRILGDIDGALTDFDAAALNAEQSSDRRLLALIATQKAEILSLRGDYDVALSLLRDVALPGFLSVDDERSIAVTLSQIAEIYVERGELVEAISVLRENALPIFEQLADARDGAIVRGKIADILQMSGELDEALAIRNEEHVIYKQLGDEYSMAVTVSNIADIQRKSGDLVGALRLLREGALPTFERLGYIRDAALAMGSIAEVLRILGDLNQSLYLLRDRALPIFDRLGDVYSIAITKVRMASALAVTGGLDEAIRIIGDEVLPDLVRIGAVQVLMVSRADLAQFLMLRNEAGDLTKAHSLLTLARETAREMKLPEEAQIQAMLDGISTRQARSVSA